LVASPHEVAGEVVNIEPRILMRRQATVTQVDVGRRAFFKLSVVQSMFESQAKALAAVIGADTKTRFYYHQQVSWGIES
jgi:hypothetical protein